MTSAAKTLKQLARPAWHRFSNLLYQRRYRSGLHAAIRRYGAARIEEHPDGVRPVAGPERIWEKLAIRVPPEVALLTADLEAGGAGHVDHLGESTHSSVDARPGPGLDGASEYLARYPDAYRTIGNSREKALEHALTAKLMDLTRVRRLCDIAASRSPLEEVFRQAYPEIEYWKQDLIFRTELDRRIIGGQAQRMREVPDGFFDLLTLHCSFEHFHAASDSEFIREADRVLSAAGACLIVPLYLDLEARVFFDPAVIPVKSLAEFDAEAKLCPSRNYRQDHGRYYSPETLAHRVLEKLPSSLRASVIRFLYDPTRNPEYYLHFGLVLHRPSSVFRRELLRQEHSTHSAKGGAP